MLIFIITKQGLLMTKTEKKIWLGEIMMHIPKLGHGAIGLLLWMVDKSDNDGFFKSSFRDITAETDKSIGTVHRTFKGLIKENLLEVISGSGSQARTYKLTLKK